MKWTRNWKECLIQWSNGYLNIKYIQKEISEHFDRRSISLLKFNLDLWEVSISKFRVVFLWGCLSMGFLYQALLTSEPKLIIYVFCKLIIALCMRMFGLSDNFFISLQNRKFDFLLSGWNYITFKEVRGSFKKRCWPLICHRKQSNDLHLQYRNSLQAKSNKTKSLSHSFQ